VLASTPEVPEAPASTPEVVATATATVEPAPDATPPAFIIERAGALTSASAPGATPRRIVLSGGGVPVVVLDPGHGGDESGAAAYGVIERDSNLDIAQRAAAYLRAAGVDVVLTREDEHRAAGPSSGEFRATRADLQARVTLANAVDAAVFVSLHSNGSGDPATRGVEVYWESRQPWAGENLRLAQSLLNGVVEGLTAAGYPTTSRGTIDAACWRNRGGRCVGLFVLSPAGALVESYASGPGATPSATATQDAPAGAIPPGTARAKEPTKMPAALVESLFVSNVEDAALLRSDHARDAIARGLSKAILTYLGREA